MTYSEVIETRGKYRALIELDESPSAPDWDGMAHVYEIGGYDDRPTVDTRHIDCSRKSEAEEISDALRHALYYGRNTLRSYRRSDEWTFVERYLRAFHSVVSFDRIDWDRDTLCAVVTRGLADAWGCPADLMGDTASDALKAWRAYGEGDVYGYVIEKSATWTREHDAEIDGDDSRDDWEEIDACWGYYGDDDARAQAMDALAFFAPDATSDAS